MIKFACSHCATRYQVREAFAGKASKCPACKQPIVVPQLALAAAPAPGQIDGTPSSLHQAGMNVTISLAHGSRSDARERKPPAELLANRGPSEGRYLIADEIARGGMGAIVRAVDCDIRREVAIKYLLQQGDGEKKARFIEEAQITGQLEHPNIVPIHELGLDREQRLFFAMKMVRGRSLAQVLDELRASSATAEKDWTLPRLLGVLVGVCHAVAYAHSRNVVHRDLKPANIMLGDFGEVYVMDWGLAKVVGAGPSEAVSPPAGSPAATFSSSAAGGSGSGTSSSKVVTSRELDGELTQDGAVVGTPAYMAPEQARGEVQSLDARCDIYAIGAILYELLTLLPPVEKEGGAMAILVRVAEGEIEPPCERTPQRAKLGRIPKELEAVALKALARRPQDRYPTCEALRRDIERYQEGWSVSAKQDSAVELLQKLIKRNRGASIAIGTAAVVLLVFGTVFLKLNRDARLVAEEHQRTAEREKKIAEGQKQLAQAAQAETGRAYADYQQEQGAKERVIRQSIPAMLRAGQQLANEGRIAEASQQVALAETYVPEDPDVRLLKGQLLLSEQRFAESRRELHAVLKQRPDSEPALALLELLGESAPPDTAHLFALAELLKQQQLTGLAIPLLATVKLEAEKKKPLVELYQKQIEANWPGLGKTVSLLPDGRIRLVLRGQKHVADLTPLRGMQLNVIDFTQSDRIADLSPLAGMPLESLNLGSCDLVYDISSLQGMPLTYLTLHGKNLDDISPLRGMPLRYLYFYRCGLLSDISPLRGMPLLELHLNGTSVSDLGPLAGLKIESLLLAGSNKIYDLTPLAGMPLKELDLGGCRVTDLSPLRGMPLESFKSHSGIIADISPLRGMRLKELVITANNKFSDLEPIRGMPLELLDIGGTNVSDLTPIKGMSLKTISITPAKITSGMDLLRNMESITTIIVGIYNYSPAEFWQKYDTGEFK